MIVGLGNVGSEFEGTRHNLGFMVVDEVSSKLKTKFRPGKGDYYYFEAHHAGEDLVFVKPTTFMNNSGVAVVEAAERYGVGIADLLVAYDDFNLPLGTLRIRRGGSDGGHNGVSSIIYQLNDDGFPRLRCGIGTEEVVPGRDMAEFVLSRFEGNEIPEVEKMIASASDAVFVFINEGIVPAMNRFN
ncbi:MAG TPA: aminoacyl-tRNA hydrolase [Candidatus Kryptonia bacterium]